MPVDAFLTNPERLCYSLSRSALSKPACVQWFEAKRRICIGWAPRTGKLPLLTVAAAILWHVSFSLSLPWSLVWTHNAPRNQSPVGTDEFSMGGSKVWPPLALPRWCTHFCDVPPVYSTRSQCHPSKCGIFYQSTDATQPWHDTDGFLAHFSTPSALPSIQTKGSGDCH